MAKRKIKRRRSYQRPENPRKILKEMTRDHLEVLQNIEFSIVSTSRGHDEIDDRTIASALKNAIDGSEPANQWVALIMDSFIVYRDMRAPIPDDIWTKGLKVVLDSVHTHSNRKPGEKAYLTFIRRFVM